MNDIIQTLLVILIVGYATYTLVRKFFWKPKRKSSSKGCDSCGH